VTDTEDYPVDFDGVLDYTGLDGQSLDSLIRRGLFPEPFLIEDQWCWSSNELQNWDASIDSVTRFISY
jgi:hypothetical protein